MCKQMRLQSYETSNAMHIQHVYYQKERCYLKNLQEHFEPVDVRKRWKRFLTLHFDAISKFCVSVCVLFLSILIGDLILEPNLYSFNTDTSCTEQTVQHQHLSFYLFTFKCL